jgi:hypothetical protein
MITLADGLTRKGVAEAVGVPQKTITARLAILDVPAKLDPAIAAGAIALSSVPALVAMAKVSPQLAVLVGLSSPDRIDAWAAERVVADQQGTHGLWPATNIDVERLELNAEQRKHVEALSDQWSAWRPRLGEEDLDRARAAGVLCTETDDGYGYHSAVICDTELARELTVAVLEREVAARPRRLSEDREAQGKPEPGTPEAEQLKAERKVEREHERELAVRVRGANLDLRRKLLDQLAELEFSKDLAELLAYTILSRPVEGYWTEQAAGGVYTVAQLAARGLRYVLPEWQEERQLKNGTTRVTYAGHGNWPRPANSSRTGSGAGLGTPRPGSKSSAGSWSRSRRRTGRSMSACRAPSAPGARSTQARTTGRSKRSSGSPAKPSPSRSSGCAASSATTQPEQTGGGWGRRGWPSSPAETLPGGLRVSARQAGEGRQALHR